MRNIFLVISFLVTGGLGFAQEKLTVIKDLAEHWQTFKNARFQRYEKNESARAIHFQLSSFQDADYLLVKSAKPVALFLNGKLIKDLTSDSIKINIDSLSRTSKGLFFSLFSNHSLSSSSVATQLVKTNVISSTIDLQTRAKSGAPDFFIVSSILILIAFSLLFRASPRLMLDYLNPAKTYLVREREGTLTSNRITSSTNILFYIFSCFLISLLILRWFIGSPQFSSIDVSYKRIGEAFVTWNIVSAIVFGFFVLKFLIIAVFSFAFNLNALMYLHFYNFIRVLILISLLMGTLTLVLFMFHKPQREYLTFASYLIGLITFSWLIAAYLKLLANSPFSFLHLFFYLCTTEIIPLILFFKIIS